MKKVDLYTDGACSGNPGKGGFGGILMCNGRQKEYSGFEEMTTNNRMELMAVIVGLKMLKEPVELNIYSDSAYVVNAFLEDWITGWQLKGWKNASKKPVSNIDLWQELLSLLSEHKVTWNKVKGHSDNEYNNRCDLLATSEIARHS
jgi:ribonuclease HI